MGRSSTALYELNVVIIQKSEKGYSYIQIYLTDLKPGDDNIYSIEQKYFVGTYNFAVYGPR